jgi:hypothetical protein
MAIPRRGSISIKKTGFIIDIRYSREEVSGTVKYEK